MKAQSDIATQTPEDILNELRALVVEAEKILGNDTLGPRMVGTVDAPHERLEAAQARLAQFYEDAQRRVANGAKYTDERIRSPPYQSLAVSAGTGLLAGVLLGRRFKT